MLLCLVGCFSASHAQTTKKSTPSKPAATKPAATKPGATKPAPAKPTPSGNSGAGQGTSGNTVNREPAPPMNDVEMQEVLRVAVKPGEYHEILSNYEGDWRVAVTLWSSPNSEPMTTTMKSKSQMTMDRRYLESALQGQVNDQNFEGKAITGFDNVTKKMFSIWMDNMSTGVQYTSGNFDLEKMRAELLGETMDPVTRKKMIIREVIFFKDNEQLHETYTTPPGGQEFKSMEMRMTR